MKVTPKPYYICDYCKEKMFLGNNGYTDYSGLKGTIDICSDECLDKHKKVLKEEEIDIEKHCKEYIGSFFY